MNTWFTSDLHLGHDNIIKYCARPFKTGEEMNKKIIHNWNQRIKEDDIVYHLGDFCFRGGKEGGSNKAKYWEEKLNGKIIHVSGNHDLNNSVKSILTKAIFEFGNRMILAMHVPPIMPQEVPEFFDYVLCGHVHDLWKHTFVGDRPVINVGVDQWNFYPIKLSEIIEYYEKIFKNI